MSSPVDLAARVADLEFDLQQLRQRVTWLEGQTDIATEPERASPQPAPQPPVDSQPRKHATPPPLPVAAVPAPTRHRTVPPPAATPRAAPPPKPSRWKELLMAVNLMPPRVGESGEAQIGGWWATRIGALLAVMGVVFFGVYVSAHTAPWVKWLELALIAIGVTAAGGWLERKNLRVGPVLTGAGHALIFFAAFAAYAVDPVKVVNSPWVAALMQGSAVTFIAWSGWRRDSATTATMAILLGYVSAFFAVFEGFTTMSIAAGLLLAIAAVGFNQRRQWRIPAFLSVVLNPVLTVTAMLTHHFPFHFEIGFGSTYVLILTGFAAHFYPAYREIATAGAVTKRTRRMQTVNTSLTLFAGLVATILIEPTSPFATYFLGAGLVLLSITAWTASKAPSDAILNMLAVKTASLFALAIIAHWDARTCWIALLVESLVLLAAAHRSGRNALRITALLGWILSLLFFADDVVGLHRDPVSTTGLAALIYLFASVGFFDALARQWRKAQPAHHTLDWLLGAVGAVPVWLLCSDSFGQAWAPVGGTALAIGFIGYTYARKTRVAIPSAMVALVTAHVSTQFFAESLHGASWLWAGAAPLGIGSLLLGGLISAQKNDPNAAPSPRRSKGILVLNLLGISALISAVLQTLPMDQALIAIAVLTVGVALFGLRLAVPAFTASGMVGLLVGYLLFLIHEPFTPDPTHGTWSIRLLALAAPLLWVIGSRHQNQSGNGISIGHVVVAMVSIPLVWGALESDLPTAWFALSLTAVGILFSVIAHRFRVHAAHGAASALGLLGLAGFAESYRWMNVDSASLTLSGVAVLIIAVALQPLLVLKSGREISVGLARWWTIGHAGVAAGAITLIALNDRAAWLDYGTVLWAVGGIILFGLGIWGRAKAHRFIGLLLLILCIPRVFVHDIEEAKHRIAAFIVLGLLLLWVGFSYQKFRRFIDGNSPDNIAQD